MKTYYVYVDRTNEGVPFYVGKGSSRRIANTKRNTKHLHVRNTYGFNRVVELETADESEAFAHERKLIAEYHTFIGDTQADSLACNFTSGGDGTTGFKWTSEAVARVSEQRKGRNNRIGSKHSEATKQKQRDSKLGSKNPNFGKSVWNSGKKIGPSAAKKGWENRRAKAKVNA